MNARKQGGHLSGLDRPAFRCSPTGGEAAVVVVEGRSPRRMEERGCALADELRVKGVEWGPVRDDVLAGDSFLSQEFYRVRCQRIAKSLKGDGLAIPFECRDDDSRHGADSLRQMLPALVALMGCPAPEGCGEDDDGEGRPGHWGGSRAGSLVLSLHTFHEAVVRGIEARRVPVECSEHVGIIELDRLEGLLDLSPKISWCGSPNDAGQNGLGALFDQDPTFSYFQGIEGLSSRGTEGVLHKGLNRCQHAGYQLLIMNNGRIRCDVMEQEAGVAMDEEELLNAKSQRVQEDDFGEGASRPPGFDSPGESFGGKAVIDGLIEGLHHPLESADDRLADGRAHDGGDGLSDHMGVSAYGTRQCRLNMRGECGGESFVLFAPQCDGLGEDFADGRRIGLRMINTIAELGKLGLLRGEKQRAKLSPLLFQLGACGGISRWGLVTGPGLIHRHGLLASGRLGCGRALLEFL